MRLALLCAVCLSSCAVLTASSVRPPSAVSTEAIELQLHLKEAEMLAERKCAPLRTREVGWNEEREVGAQLAVTYTAQHGHLYLDGAVEKDPQLLLNELEAKRPLSLPEGGKNAVTTHVAVVGRNLARFSARPELPWVFGVVKHDAAHAYSTPGGFVFVTTGLLKKITNEAQLAGVLAHEIAHVAQKHSLERYREAKTDACRAAVSASYLMKKGLQSRPATAQFADDFEDFELSGKQKGPFVAFIMDVVLQRIDLLGNEKEDEFDADATALELVSFAGYEPVEYERFLTLMGDSAKHPATADRVAKLKALREGELAPFARGTARPDTTKAFGALGSE